MISRVCDCEAVSAVGGRRRPVLRGCEDRVGLRNRVAGWYR